MIIDELTRYTYSIEQWDKLGDKEKCFLTKPKLDIEYIENEAKEQGIEYLQNIKHLKYSILYDRIIRYLEQNNYSTQWADVIHTSGEIFYNGLDTSEEVSLQRTKENFVYYNEK